MTDYTIFVSVPYAGMTNLSKETAETPEQALKQATSDLSGMDLADIFNLNQAPENVKFHVVADRNLHTADGTLLSSDTYDLGDAVSHESGSQEVHMVVVHPPDKNSFVDEVFTSVSDAEEFVDENYPDYPTAIETRELQ